MEVDDGKVKAEALKIIDQFQNLPRLVIFDLDHTLWPLYCQCQDKDDIPWLYPEARGIIQALQEKGIEMAIASRTPAIDIAKSFLTKLGIHEIFVAQEIFSSWTHKTEHFERIHKKTGVPYHSMLFFDDESRNTVAVSNMGVMSILVGDGVSLVAFNQGLSDFCQTTGSFGMEGAC